MPFALDGNFREVLGGEEDVRAPLCGDFAIHLIMNYDRSALVSMDR